MKSQSYFLNFFYLFIQNFKMALATGHFSRQFLRLKNCTAVFSLRNYIKSATDDPLELSREDIGKMYHIPLEKTKLAALDKILPRKLQKQVETFEECALLVRSQFLEVIHCFKAVRTTFPSIRVVLWGKFGTGKTTTLAQAVHYAQTQNWVIFNVKEGELKSFLHNLQYIFSNELDESRVGCSYVVIQARKS